MIGRLLAAIAAFGFVVLGQAAGDHPLLKEVQFHLNLARNCANCGQLEGALAHASVVTPDRKLRVKVDCSNVPSGDQGLYRNALNGAFHLWADALGEKVFEVTETRQADVVIHFQPVVSDKGMEVCGHSEWTRGVLNPGSDPTVVLTAIVQVRMFKPNGEPLTFDQLRACAAHELGHVLGLDDSSASGDIMGRMDFNRPATTIRSDEVELLVRAREEAGQIQRNVAAGLALRARRGQK